MGDERLMKREVKRNGGENRRKSRVDGSERKMMD